MTSPSKSRYSSSPLAVLLVSLLLLGLAFAGSAKAARIELTFTGTSGGVGAFDPAWSHILRSGEPLSGKLIYETDALPPSNSAGYYPFLPVEISVSVQGYNFTIKNNNPYATQSPTNSGWISVENGTTSPQDPDKFWIRARQDTAQFPFNLPGIKQIEIQFWQFPLGTPTDPIPTLLTVNNNDVPTSMGVFDPTKAIIADGVIETSSFNWVFNIDRSSVKLTGGTPPCGVLTSGLDTCILEKGDILLGLTKARTDFFGYTARLLGGTYWFHAAIYVGDGNIAQALGSSLQEKDQVHVAPLTDLAFGYWNVDLNDWAVVRPKTSSGVKNSAVEYARTKGNQNNPPILYHDFPQALFTGRNREDKFYCSQFVWKSYEKQGLDLETRPIDFGLPSIWSNTFPTYVNPDDLYFSVVPEILTQESKSILVAQKRNSVGRSLGRTVFRLFSPADLLLQDRNGRRTGFDPSTGQILKEIPGTTYTGPTSHPEGITATGVEGDLKLHVIGNDNGVYTLEAMNLDLVGGTPRNETVSRTTTGGNVDTFLVKEDGTVYMAVEIDIKPGSDPNSINLRSRGNVPVAILSSAFFDATRVDPQSIDFGSNGATEAHGDGHIEDVDGNGDMDLVLHFKTQETGILCGDTSASLTGQTFDGQAIEGSDAIRTVGCK